VPRIETTRRAALLGGGVLAAPFIAGRAQAQGITLRSADVHPDGYPTVEGVKHMGRLLQERTDGRIRIQVFHSRQLGDEKDSLEQTRLGVIDMTRVNTAPLNNLVPETLVAGLPFLFRDTEHMQRTMDGPIGEEIGRACLPHNLVALCYYDAGARSFYTRAKPARTPDDLRGMKIRVQQSDMWVAMMRAFGANATPLPTARSTPPSRPAWWTGRRTTSLLPHRTALRGGEELRHERALAHARDPGDGQALLRPPPRGDQEIVRQAARESVPVMRDAWVRMEADARRQVEAGGAQVVEATSRPSPSSCSPCTTSS
jgi:TRAP-type C4-dicarboxylate transport system substrate-binding protein